MTDHRIPILWLLVITSLAYTSSFLGTFQFDDYLVIVNNSAVHSWQAWWLDLAQGGIRPILKATYTLNWALDRSPFGFHLFNLLIHVVNTALLYLLAISLLRQCHKLTESSSRISAFFAALLFALHPVQTEAVTYISGRSTSLMGCFFLAALLVYIWGRERHRRVWIYLVSPVFFLLSLGVKETAAILPAVLFLWEVVIKRELPWTRVFRFHLVHWGLLLTAGGMILLSSRYQQFFSTSFEVRSVYENLLSQINGISYLLSRLLLVHRLNIDPDLPVFEKWHPILAIEVVFLLALFFAGLFAIRKRPWQGFGVLWFFVMLLPTNSFIPRMDVANERAIYLAAWGLFLPVAVHIASIKCVRPIIIRGGIVCLCLIMIFFTTRRNLDYRNPVTLWEDTLKKSPLKPRVYYNLGKSYEAIGRFKDAQKVYREALILDPNYAYAREKLYGKDKADNYTSDSRGGPSTRRQGDRSAESHK